MPPHQKIFPDTEEQACHYLVCPVHSPSFIFHHCALPPNKIAISWFSRVPFEKVSFIRKETAFFSITFQNLEQCLVVNEKHLWNGEWVFAMQWLSLCFTELKQFTSLNHTLIDLVNGTWPSDINVHRLSICYLSLPHHLPSHPKLHFCCTGWFWWSTFLSFSAQNLELISVLPSYLCSYLVDEVFCCCCFMLFPELILLHQLDQHPEIFCFL